MSSEVVLLAYGFLFLAYIGLQGYAIIKWRGWWRGLAIVPLFLLAGVLTHNFPLIHSSGFPAEWIFIAPCADTFLMYLLPLAVIRWLVKDNFKSGSILIRIGCSLAILNLGLALFSLCIRHSLSSTCYPMEAPDPGRFQHEIPHAKDFMNSNYSDVGKARMVVLVRTHSWDGGGGGLINDYVFQDDFQINTRHFSINIRREGNDLIANEKRLKKGNSYTLTLWPMWDFWYAEVESLSIKKWDIVSKVRIWENAWDWQDSEKQPVQELKTDILYVKGINNFQWRLSWRGPGLLVASLLLMWLGRRRLPKKPAISES